MSTPTPKLSGEALFRAAAIAMEEWSWADDPFSVLDSQWRLVPAMLDWLRGKRWSLFVKQYNADGGWHTDADAWPPFPNPAFAQLSGRCPDLPTALARLVVRVAELEKQP